MPQGRTFDLDSRCSNRTCSLNAPVSILCNSEYVLVGYGVLVCVGNGMWHKPLPICESNKIF